jgi:hypothetical protein
VLRTVDCGLGRAAQSTPSHVLPQVGPLRFSSELFLRTFVTICDRLDLTLVPGVLDMTFGRGHIEDNDECVFLCATPYLVALKRDVSISHYLLPPDRSSSSSSF